MRDKMAISAYILKIVEKDAFLTLQMRAEEDFNRHQLSCQILLFCSILNNCEFYLITHRTILVNWKQIYSSFSEQLDFSRLQNSMKFSLSKFHVFYFVWVTFSHSTYVSSSDIVLLSMYLRTTMLEQTILCTCLFHCFYLY